MLFCHCSDGQTGKNETENMTDQHKHTNALIHESSPYLLQHAHNPVNWYPWGKEALEKAKEEDKMILVSIGYSACHWCHVMERESFEDEDVAAFMNENFVCIKVDREERPDIDQIYMNAIQLITGQGGWPLNCFALPDGRPFYGGTYFPKKNWLYLMENIVKEYKNDRQKVEEYADNLTNGISKSELVSLNDERVEQKKYLDEMVAKWKLSFDNKEGGPNRAPKFPLPNNYEFLLDYGILTGNKEILNHVELTLDKMAMGGIYDQIGGGFARYSTDAFWKVPHFEKMLYDNAQLITLYSKAYRYYKKPEYINIIYQSLDFIRDEMTGPNGEFYSALDADSEGEEGKYYVWTEKEIKNIKNIDFDLIKSYYNVEDKYQWEGKYILHRTKADKEVSEELGYGNTTEDYMKFVMNLSVAKMQLLGARSKRVKPGLDDKSLTSWNAMMISAYAEAYKSSNDYAYRHAAKTNAELIWNTMHKEDGALMHNYKNGKVSINGFLEDYALTAKAFIDLYQVEFDEVWINRAEEIVNYAMTHFYDKERSMFYFTSDKQSDLVARKMELTDNVIPASNSIMANVLYSLGLLKDKNEWIDISVQMLQNLTPYMSDYGTSYSNWGILMLKEAYPFYEIAVSGNDFRVKCAELQDTYLPNTLYVASKDKSNLPLLENKNVEGKTMVYVCVNKTCQLPVEETEKALSQITFH